MTVQVKLFLLYVSFVFHCKFSQPIHNPKKQGHSPLLDVNYCANLNSRISAVFCLLEARTSA